MAGRNAAEQAEKRLRHGLEGIRGRLEERVGGPARLQVIVLLAAVLGLDLADKGAVSAVAGGLKRTFDISNTEIGLLVSLVSLVGAVATLPVGSLVDRINRTRLLVLAISLWAVAMLVSGLASSYLFLLTARLFLGGVTAAAVPTVASLVGDFFPARERAAMYGYILAGELVGVGFGFLFAGEISSLIDWRWAFFALSVPSAALAWALWRYLPEPARGGQSWLRPGQVELESATRGQGGRTDEAGQGQDQGQEVPQGSELAREEVRQSRVEPHEELVLREDPLRHNLWWAVRYVLRIRTNLLLIVASALGYYFFSGVRTFAMIYITEHFGITRSTASVLVILVGLGGLAGVLIGGRLADHLLRRGWLGARILVPGSGLALTVACVAPAVWTQNLFLGLGLLGLGAACL
ncbi:MAG TPA: MFS transporter, partial [Gammaproteobacteria bacterium]|nr:MFS transporter [Gammaproteobacteria bacterium]